MSIELVDKIDQAKSGRRYQKVGGLNDLFLRDENHSQNGAGGCDGSVSSQASDYIGLEMEQRAAIQSQAQQSKKRVSKLIALVLTISTVIAVGVYFHRDSNTSNTSTGNTASGNTGSNSNLRNPMDDQDDDSLFSGGTIDTSSTSSKPTTTTHHNNNKDKVDVDVDVDTTISSSNSAWPTAAPLKAFKICQPKLHYTHHNKRIHHLHDLVLVPEDTSDDTDSTDSTLKWRYSFSAMDIDELASIVAVGMSDFGRYSGDGSGGKDTGQAYSVGMVRAFAFHCHSKKFQQLGQDLLGDQAGDNFGYALSSSKDGTVMAVSAVQDETDNEKASNGYVQVYYLDSNVWTPLGQRVEELKDTQDYYNLGSAIDLSDNGETLAILGIVSATEFVTRVFDYDPTSKKWKRKGHDLQVTVDTSEESWWSFQPKVSLSEEGDELSLLDPKFGLIKYHFEFEQDKWVQQTDQRMPSFQSDDHWVEGLDFDESGNVFAFSAYDLADDGTAHMAKLVDFSNDVATEIYNKTVSDVTVDIQVAVSNDGAVAAIVESKYDLDDNAIWEYDSVGALTILSKNNHGKWKVLGGGTNGGKEEIGVPGSHVTLSGDGSIAAVGTDSVVALYYISLNHVAGGGGGNSSSSSATADDIADKVEGDDTPSVDVTVTTDDDDNDVNATATVLNATFFEICAPFPDAIASSNSSHVGDLDDLPKQPDEHTLSISLSGDASIVAVGIDSFEEEDRGMVRIFAWDCQKSNYSQMGQDLFGDADFDGFGQSVDVSNDGKTLVVGANQPPPGKAGYVDIYHFGDDTGLWVLAERFEEVKDNVEDIGREVRISSDGSTVAIHGSFVDKDEGGAINSFIRIIEMNTHGKWNNKGDDLVSSIAYDEYGTRVKLSFAADGSTLGVTGSYNTFMAKMYTFNDNKSNWTEHSIPPIKMADADDDDNEDDCFDQFYNEYFDGTDIALSDDGESVAISGMQWSTGTAIVRVLALDAISQNWTMSHDAIATDKSSYSPNSIGISGNAQVLAVGINTHDDTLQEQGTLTVSQMDDSDSGWKTLGSVDGRSIDDLLGSRVSVSSDGSLAAASSRKGYVSFFKTGV
eukprot:CAMPEP_0119010194 /NCGR_PEP_ID=MMETSP1176-20130426/4853_1 /TAXON_ID=265551 /ORGANISM="Synedropsis recta cf, Strain CCMP1620" /LENGTH=1086 /DNA_ID=CAMNT_0006962821 /DNA_START=71 /DNA_END=3331 /DNA_ORIENTATION=+